MLALTKRTEYALIAVGHLARQVGGLCSAREIADRFGLKTPLLTNVLKSLHQNGLLHSVRGASGGYRLAGDALQLTLLDVVEAVEGPVRIVSCADGAGEDSCDLHGTCPIRRPLTRVHELLKEFLDRVSVAELAAGGDGLTELPGGSRLKVLTN